MDRIKKRNFVIILLALALGMVFSAAPDQAWAGKYKKASQKNESDCRKWCHENKEQCEFCDTKSGCGQGYVSIRKWGGRGKNWYACGKKETRREAGQRHYNDCKKWCDENPGCDRCSKKSGCGKGYRKLKGWTGRGENWYACEKREKTDPASQNNKAACREYCKGKYGCKCKNRPCHHTYKKLKTFGGRGENWYACDIIN
jgi:hypothetical protein